MNVLIYEHYDYMIHGNQKYLTLLFEVMGEASGSDVSMLLVVPSRGALYEYASMSVEVIALKKGSVLSRAISLFRIFSSFRPDIVICNNEPSLFTAAPAALLNRVPLVWHNKNLRRSFLTDLASFVLATRVLTIASECIGNKHFLLRKVFGGKVRVLPIGIRLDEYMDIGPPAFSDNTRKILLIGSVCREKGIDLALDSMEELDAMGIDAELRIVGMTPPGRESYEKEIRDRLGRYSNVRVSLMGWRGDMRELLEWSEVVVHPSRSDGVPRALVEAMAAARPVVASEVGGIPGLIEDGRTGLLAPPDDARSFTRCIRHLFDDPSLARRIGGNAREHVALHHDINRHRDLLLSNLDEVVKHG